MSAQTANGSLAVTPDGKRLFESGGVEGASSIASHDVRPDGRLVNGRRLLLTLFGPGFELVMNPSGKVLYSVTGDAGVVQYALRDDGKLGQLARAQANLLAADVIPDGSSLYAARGDISAVGQFAVRADGTLAPRSPATVPAGSRPSGVAVALAPPPQPASCRLSDPERVMGTVFRDVLRGGKGEDLILADGAARGSTAAAGMTACTAIGAGGRGAGRRRPPGAGVAAPPVGPTCFGAAAATIFSTEARGRTSCAAGAATMS